MKFYFEARVLFEVEAQTEEEAMSIVEHLLQTSQEGAERLRTRMGHDTWNMVHYDVSHYKMKNLVVPVRDKA